MALPKDPVVIEEAMDPSALLDYLFDFSRKMQDGEVIDPDQVTITMSPEGAALGITISTEREPVLVEGDRVIQVWLSVAEPFRSNAAFAGDGTTVGIEAHVRTNSDPYREDERTFTITVRQR